MTRSSQAAALAVLLIAVALPACGKHDERHAPGAQSAAAAKNPSDFPLDPHARVLTVVPVDSAQMFAAIKLSDPHADVPRNFRGNEVIFQTDTSMKRLAAWVAALKASPPRGFHVSATHLEVSGEEKGPPGDTLVGGQFDSEDARRSVYVIVADPRRIREQIGSALDLVDNYTKVPDMLRGPIDDQVRKQVGYSVSELLDARSPVGAALAALKQLENRDRRAILIVDESSAG